MPTNRTRTASIRSRGLAHDRGAACTLASSASDMAGATSALCSGQRSAACHEAAPREGYIGQPAMAQSTHLPCPPRRQAKHGHPPDQPLPPPREGRVRQASRLRLKGARLRTPTCAGRRGDLCADLCLNCMRRDRPGARRAPNRPQVALHSSALVAGQTWSSPLRKHTVGRRCWRVQRRRGGRPLRCSLDRARPPLQALGQPAQLPGPAQRQAVHGVSAKKQEWGKAEQGPAVCQGGQTQSASPVLMAENVWGTGE